MQLQPRSFRIVSQVLACKHAHTQRLLGWLLVLGWLLSNEVRQRA